jgi:hypothetical protein
MICNKPSLTALINISTVPFGALAIILLKRALSVNYGILCVVNIALSMCVTNEISLEFSLKILSLYAHRKRGAMTEEK